MTDKTPERRTEDRPFPGPERRLSRREELEQWWFLVARILAFMFGLIVLAFNLVVDKPEGMRLLLAVVIGAGLMWPIVGPGVTQAFAVLRGGGDRGGQ